MTLERRARIDLAGQISVRGRSPLGRHDFRGCGKTHLSFLAEALQEALPFAPWESVEKLNPACTTVKERPFRSRVSGKIHLPFLAQALPEDLPFTPPGVC
jgi:hypothetical protein